MTKVLSLGQCAADHGSISRLLAGWFDVDVVPADSTDEALAELRREATALVLVNRVLDANGESGLDFIRMLKAEPGVANTPVMLVSNYEDAQRAAVELGALRGFGKAELERPATLDRLRAVLTREATNAGE